MKQAGELTRHMGAGTVWEPFVPQRTVFNEAVVEGFETGVVSSCDEGRKVQNGAHSCAASVNRAFAARRTAVSIKWSQADQSGNLLAGEASKFWEHRDQCRDGHGADTRRCFE